MSKAHNRNSQDRFADYYANASLDERTIARFQSTKEAIMRVRARFALPLEQLQVADIGCGAATQCMIWARNDHAVSGLDINERLIELGRRRAADEDLNITLEIGSAVALPWNSESMDVCLLPEVLEHVEDWRACLAEAVRVLKPNGLLYLSTSNRLCPVQQEFELVGYSWYPSWLKRRYVRLALTKKPELVNHAKYPAVHWFDFYSLRKANELAAFECLDRFDVAALAAHGAIGRLVLTTIRHVPTARWLGHVATPYTAIFAVKRA